jgi:hypothetical protein
MAQLEVCEKIVEQKVKYDDAIRSSEGADSQEDQIKHLLHCRVRMDDAKERLENVASKLGARTAGTCCIM